MYNKLAAIFGIAIMLLSVLGIVMVYKAVTTHEEYSKKALAQLSYQNETIVAKSGDILDSSGKVIAASEKVYILILDPSVLYGTDELHAGSFDATIRAMVQCFNLEEVTLREAFEENKTSSYLRFNGKTILSEEQVNAFEAEKERLDNAKEEELKEGEVPTARIRGVWFETEYRRVYPYNELASKVIGYTTEDTAEGLWGLERQYNSELRGTNGRSYGYIGENTDLERSTIPAIDGNTLVTTIDMDMTRIISDNVQEWMEQYGASNLAVLAMNPQNGEILSMVSNTDYDLNYADQIQVADFYTEEQIEKKVEEVRAALEKEEEQSMPSEDTIRKTAMEELQNSVYRNYMISNTSEPGSTAKLMTIASALDEHVITESDAFECHGSKTVAGRVIRCHNVALGGCSAFYGKQYFSLKEAISQSCNVALMDIAEKLGRTEFSRYQKTFNLGQKTGIDLPGEASGEGLLYTEEQLNPVELATSSFGQGFNVTMIQLASAFSSLVNGGTYYRPHVVKQIRNAEGGVVKETEPIVVRETISKDTSELIKEAAYMVVESGTGGGTKLQGYHIGGKTGTAEKLPRGNGNYVVSIITAAPIEDPQVVLYVLIDEPNVPNQNDSYPAQQLAGWIWEDLVSYIGIYSDFEVNSDGVIDTSDRWPEGTSYMDEIPKTAEQLLLEEQLQQQAMDRYLESQTEAAAEETVEEMP